MKVSLLGFSIFFTLSLVAAPLHADEGRIGSWNIQFLGHAHSRPGTAKNHLQKADDIAGYILSANVDILALQEICDDKPQTALLDNSILDDTISLTSIKTGSSWRYLLFENRAKDDRSQVCGVLWNTGRASLVGEPYRVPISRGSDEASKAAWDRHPHAVKFSFGSGRADVVVISMHNKSNVTGQGKPKPVDIRKNEAMQLIARLGNIETHFDDGDIILIGDTNVKSSGEPLLERLSEVGFVDLNKSSLRTTYKGSAAFDRSFVKTGEPETSSATFQVFKPSGVSANEFFLKYSDHYMVITAIEVSADSDE